MRPPSTMYPRALAFPRMKMFRLTTHFTTAPCVQPDLSKLPASCQSDTDTSTAPDCKGLGRYTAAQGGFSFPMLPSLLEHYLGTDYLQLVQSSRPQYSGDEGIASAHPQPSLMAMRCAKALGLHGSRKGLSQPSDLPVIALRRTREVG